MKRYKTIFILFFLLFYSFSFLSFAQDDTLNKIMPPAEPVKSLPSSSPGDTAQQAGGVSVAPTKIYFTVKPGQSKTSYITVHNTYSKTYKMEVRFSDFEMNKSGKTAYQKAGAHENTLTDWISFSPTFFELAPGQKQKIAVTLNVPDIPAAYRAKWGVVFINQAIERQTIDAESSDKTIAMGVIPTFSFGVFIYQNPPNVIINKVEITSFTKTTIPKSKDKADAKEKTILELKAKNTGDGISFSTSYVELTNLKTGKKTKLGKKSFTILPDHERVFVYELPENLEKGEYSVFGVLDFGSKTELEGAELQIKIE